MPMTIATCGHGARPLDAYLAALRAHDVTRYVDVRRWPVSRRHPQFSRESLERALREAGVAYVHAADLGGHREPRADSRNAALRREFLRGYADWLESPAATDALLQVIAEARHERGLLVVACAETRPADCHRQILADALMAAGVRVVHVVDESPVTEHVPHRAARFASGRVTYPAEGQAGLFDG